MKNKPTFNSKDSARQALKNARLAKALRANLARRRSGDDGQVGDDIEAGRVALDPTAPDDERQ